MDVLKKVKDKVKSVPTWAWIIAVVIGLVLAVLAYRVYTGTTTTFLGVWGQVKKLGHDAKDKIHMKVTEGVEAVSGFNPPVTPKSSNEHILLAFEESGYFSHLENSIQQGDNPETYVAIAKQNPKGWLEDHIKLYDTYPDWFAPS